MQRCVTKIMYYEIIAAQGIRMKRRAPLRGSIDFYVDGTFAATFLRSLQRF